MTIRGSHEVGSSGSTGILKITALHLASRRRRRVSILGARDGSGVV